MIFKVRRNASKSTAMHRKIDRRVEIEALECRRLLTAIVVTTVSDSTPHTGESLRDAIATANADARAGTSDTITFASSLNDDTITLTQGQLELGQGGAGSGVITINGANQITINGNGISRVLAVDSGVNASVSGLALTNGLDNSSGGGGIYNEGTLTVTNCTFSSDSFQGTDGAGGGLENNGGSVTISGSTFTGDTSNANGGGAESFNGTMNVTNTGFLDCSGSIGAGIAAVDATLTLNVCSFSDDGSASEGGCVYAAGGKVTINTSVLTGNYSDFGGGIYVDTGCTMTVSQTSFGDQAEDNGGAIYNAGTLTVSNSSLGQSSAGENGYGGAIYNSSSLTVYGSTFYGNSVAEGFGAAIYNDTSATAIVSNSTFSSNTSTYWGGAIANYGTLTVSNSIFSNNVATNYGGGGIMNDGGTATIFDSTFSNNTGEFGGGVDNYYTTGLVTIANSTFSGNTAGSGGGIANDGTMTISSCTISGNSASVTYGGGVSNDGTLSLVNTLVALNTSSPGDGPDVYGPVQSTSSFNLIGDGSEMTGISNGSNGNQVGASGSAINPGLAPLYYNGGATPTMALEPNSPALYAGGYLTVVNAAVGTTDTTIPLELASAVASTPGSYVIQIDNEQMLVTDVNTQGGEVTVTRGYNGTTPATHSAGARVYWADDQAGQTRSVTQPDIGAFEDQSLFSTVAPLPAVEPSNSFLVAWSGHPATDAPSIASYTIYVSDNGGAYKAWQTDTAATAALYTGGYGDTYSFYSVATDALGNVQVIPSAAQATTMTPALAAPAITSANKATLTVGASGSFTVTASGVPTPTFSETGTLPSGVTFNTVSGVLSGTAASGKVGTYNLTFDASNGVGTAATQSFTLTVAKAATTTKLTKNTTAPITYGQSVTFTAVVAASHTNAITPGGTVSFMDGTTTLGTATLSGGIAKLTTTTLGAGSHPSITAVYAGDGNFTTSTSGALSQTVSKSASSTTLTKNTTAPITYGQSVTLTATLAAVSPGAGIPTGTVTFEDGSTVLGTGTLSGSVAKFSTTTLPAGSNSIKAVYNGDANFNTSTSNALSQTVNKSASTTKLTKNTTTAIQSGQSVTFTATLAAVSPGAGTPTGTVTFMDNGSSIGTETLSAGVATLITTTLPVGSNSITAIYGGDTDFTTSTSGALTQTVTS